MVDAQQVKGKEASIKVHVDNNAKVTWAGHKEIGHRRTWITLAEALFHDFHKTVVICQMKHLPEHCLTQTPTHEFKFMCFVNDEIQLCICKKCGSCDLLKSLPDTHLGDIHRCAPGNLQQMKPN